MMCSVDDVHSNIYLYDREARPWELPRVVWKKNKENGGSSESPLEGSGALLDMASLAFFTRHGPFYSSSTHLSNISLFREVCFHSHSTPLTEHSSTPPCPPPPSSQRPPPQQCFQLAQVIMTAESYDSTPSVSSSPNLITPNAQRCTQNPTRCPCGSESHMVRLSPTQSPPRTQP